jgi:hypothetical protein
METIDKLLASVPKDVNGFEDLDKFWEISGKFVFLVLYRFQMVVF